MSVTAYDVAKRAGVSVGTVSRFLTGHGYVGKDSRQRIADAITQLGFVPSRAAASLRTKKTGLIGFVVSDLRNPFTAVLATALQERSREHGFGVFIAHTMGSPDRAIAAVDLLRGHGVDGLVVTPPASPALVEQLAELRQSGMPVIGLGLRTDPLSFDLLTVDTRSGARAATDHLVGLGHERIAFIGTSRSSGRYQGYRAALKAAGLPLQRERVQVGAVGPDAGWNATTRFAALPDRPTAIFAFDDATALSVLQRAHALDWPVPKALSVVGFDDVDLARRSVPPLTTVVQPTDELGRIAVAEIVRQLTDSLAEPAVITLPTELVVRGSTGPAPNAGSAAKGTRRKS
ncbi:LacI family DNA-binding transcriptional regulator [Kribbella sp. NPDC006257]|uniref:LacI family DNA-binding transcriptional regulator n=1 Tax=Kribbella sp. NPDC006257 TaxID=3156738 RepID=UPI0033AECD28